ncbi:hypothetical protein DRF75_02240 [Ehrlichia minasensis]|uniref:Transmembrane protein n=1 Tax=Ehrlichia minasensis TaxID=1242993 RepID=A0A4Q6I6A3_9RICK|nr:hypothetical protein [Ehrlichia minasensis]RZB12820.1 hypothetical protein DRF75_02240 [Ehrlichia minasensis]
MLFPRDDDGSNEVQVDLNAIVFAYLGLVFLYFIISCVLEDIGPHNGDIDIEGLDIEALEVEDRNFGWPGLENAENLEAQNENMEEIVVDLIMLSGYFLW